MSNKSNYNSSSLSKSKFSNERLEANLLGLVYVENRTSVEIIPYLTKEDFTTQENVLFFEILKELFEENLSINYDQVMLRAKKKNYKFITFDYLSYIQMNAGLKSNIVQYLQELERLTKLRAIESRLSVVQNKLLANTPVDEKDVIRDLQDLLLNIDKQKTSSDFLTSKEVSDLMLEDLERRRTLGSDAIAGVPSGFSFLDQITQGFKPGELIILAARPAMGKTAFALNIANHVALNKMRVIFFTLEMPATQLMTRLYGINSEIELNKFKKPSDLSEHDMFKIQSVRASRIDKMDLLIDESAKTDLSTLLWKCRRLSKVGGIDLIIIDYLQLLTVDASKPSRDRQNEVSTISRNLKTLALELKVPVIALSQLSRAVEQREDKRPLLSDLRESGTIEQDADIVLFLYRQSYYNRKSREDMEKELMEFGDIGDITEVIISKHRNGSIGNFNLMFKMSCGKFENIIWDFDKPDDSKGDE